MNTTFTISTTDASVKQKFAIDLGQDILDNKSIEDIKELARRCAVIDLQNSTTFGLRACETAEDVVKVLKPVYEEVSATIYVSTTKPKKELTPQEMVAALKAKGMTPEQILAMLSE